MTAGRHTGPLHVVSVDVTNRVERANAAALATMTTGGRNPICADCGGLASWADLGRRKRSCGLSMPQRFEHRVTKAAAQHQVLAAADSGFQARKFSRS